MIEQLGDRRGVIEDYGPIELTASGGVFFPIIFENSPMEFHLDFDPDNKITGVRITNYAPRESVGKSVADLGEDTLRTHDLNDYNELAERFAADSGHTRFVTILSPT